MEVLKRKIQESGVVRPGNILMVNSFLNHQVDIPLLQQIGQEFRRRFDGVPINKIFTIEASGIGIAAMARRTRPLSPSTRINTPVARNAPTTSCRRAV